MAKGLQPAYHRNNAYVDGTAVTPADGTDLTDGPCRALWVGGAGNINLTTAGGTTFVVTAIAAGTLLPIATKRVLSTSTTATLIIALY